MISAHLVRLETALRNDPTPYFPVGGERRRQGNLRLGREIGRGLGAYEDWETWAQASYSRFVVANSRDSTGVTISSKEWMVAIQEGIREYRDRTAVEPGVAT